MAILLFIIFFSLSIITYFLFKRNIMAPPFIFCTMYLISVGLALLEWEPWQLNDYSTTAFNIYVYGAIVFILIGFVISKIEKITIVRSNCDREISLEAKNVNNNFLIFFIILDIFAIVLLYHDVRRIGGGAGNISQILESYRNVQWTSTTAQLPSYDQQLSKVMTSVAFVCSFIFINNKMAGQKKNEKLLIIPIILYLISTLLQSNRFNILTWASTCFVYYCMIRAIKYKNNKLSFRLLIRVLLIFTLLLVFFYLVRLFVGRSGSSDTSLSYYISMYGGGPVKLFDLFVRNPIYNTWGASTFRGISRGLRVLGILPGDYTSQIYQEFRTVNGMDLGNVYSAYRQWIADFGFKDMWYAMIVFSVFFNWIYFHLIKTNYYKKTFSLILYGYITFPLFMHPIDDVFFPNFLSFSFLTFVLIFYVVYILLTKKIRIGERK